MSLHDLLGPFSLAFTVSQLTHPIFTPWSPPLLLLHSARCQKQGRLSLLCVPPPFLHRIPAFHLSYHHSQKSHRGRLRVEARGIGDGGERKLRQGWKEGRETLLTLLTLLANRSLHNTGKIIWKAVQPSLLCPPSIQKCICSSEHDMAILPGTTINNFSQLNLD